MERGMSLRHAWEVRRQAPWKFIIHSATPPGYNGLGNRYSLLCARSPTICLFDPKPSHRLIYAFTLLCWCQSPSNNNISHTRVLVCLVLQPECGNWRTRQIIFFYEYARVRIPSFIARSLDSRTLWVPNDQPLPPWRSYRSWRDSTIF